MDNFNLAELDLYEILEIDLSCSTSDIKKAYRKKALQCHPDKNPDNPDAAKEFHKLSKILEILTDEAARKAYDRVLKGRKEAALRHKELDSKRRKFKEDLEYREKLVTNKGKNFKNSDQLLKEEMERLSKEGSKAVEEEIQFVLNKLKDYKKNSDDNWDSSRHRIKIEWKAAKNDESNGGYSKEMLHQYLSKYGDVIVLVMSPTKKGSALVEFKTRSAAEMAVDLEMGLAVNPIKLKWINGPPPSNSFSRGTLVKDTDFESVTLMKMRQAEERKKLIEQMMAEDAER